MGWRNPLYLRHGQGRQFKSLPVFYDPFMNPTDRGPRVNCYGSQMLVHLIILRSVSIRCEQSPPSMSEHLAPNLGSLARVSGVLGVMGLVAQSSFIHLDQDFPRNIIPPDPPSELTGYPHRKPTLRAPLRSPAEWKPDPGNTTFDFLISIFDMN